MLHINPSALTHRRLLLIKWLMVLIPSITIAVGHVLIGHVAGNIAGPVLLAFLVLAFAYMFVFRILHRLEGEALSREQDILTMKAMMQERERLSRELHDGAAQLVARLLLRLDTVKDLVAADRDQEAKTELEQLHGVANELYEDIGESITGIRTDVSERGLLGTLREYAEQVEERYQILVSLYADEAADRLSPLVSFQIFRFIQEALTNVRKHAGAHEATITLTSCGPDRLEVVVADDGLGFTPGSSGNGQGRPMGLTSMRERVESLGGTFRVESQPSSSTRVIAIIPMPRTSRETGHVALANPPG